ncbi:unnamed protein product [Pleuronectes platessa]|uniref:Uncharacterized protein n=1 Tax=Pleuronectes platessa TaxID=8262 RepID=A0A9N7Z705_PLEPL|nr:unnamed protein product [Pleuronectes platessa]
MPLFSNTSPPYFLEDGQEAENRGKVGLLESPSAKGCGGHTPTSLPTANLRKANQHLKAVRTCTHSSDCAMPRVTSQRKPRLRLKTLATSSDTIKWKKYDCSSYLSPVLE